MKLCDVDPRTHVHAADCDATNCPDEAKMADDWAEDARLNGVQLPEAATDSPQDDSDEHYHSATP
jgi:hypothetical protein